MTVVKRSLFFSCIIMLSFFCYMKTTNASVIASEPSFVESYQLFDEEGSLNSCEGLLGDPNDHRAPAYWLQWILNIMKYVAIAALLILSLVDFIKALVSDDKDSVKKASMTTAKRFIYCVLIFFAPIILDFLMELLGLYGSCGLG